MINLIKVAAAIILLFSLLGCSQKQPDAEPTSVTASNNLHMQRVDTGIYSINVPSGLDTVKFEATITLDQAKKIHKVKFPNGGTETTVFVYDNTYLETMQRNTLTKITPLVKGNFILDQEVLLDITNLNRGKYYVHYLSCGLGGVFLLTIK